MEKLKIASVDAYPVRLWRDNIQGKLPEFASDEDPARWRYYGPYAQLVGAIIVVIQTVEGVVGFGLGGGGRPAVAIIHGHLRDLLVGNQPPEH
jgi:hypothetical protein